VKISDSRLLEFLENIFFFQKLMRPITEFSRFKNTELKGYKFGAYYIINNGIE
jgi:hypothetical protein